ncbi:protein YrbN [Salmonella enterica]|uniref:Protein YrbN n=1 Tax=Salmonella enterica subsp. enterica serovar Carrau TaxID=1160739 RepID=A0A752RPH4_SALET|nr:MULTISPECIES: protein YrbN [Enterobacteriaceae]EBP9907787.1 protein YrbN [Salmonella enterica subsp. enterica]EDQ6231025.1 protein YrbN [Salmonella enterica subsp. enterica serovar Tucson]EDS4140356.1 protein YrbN [Salmonella enterica subsp. enterica serovar Madelia]EEC0897912.1 protein YrbN [Salmonella enterica subsp. enterica serovar Koumra]EEM7560247.1 protein YrbN [Salmonella enterica subsp. enterica serovar Infantis]EGF6395428.1 protein YrbN [Salmonella enterica subsp. enterica serova
MKIVDQFHDELCRLAAINFEAHVLHG